MKFGQNARLPTVPVTFPGKYRIAMTMTQPINRLYLVSALVLLSAPALAAGPVYQPPGANLVYGDVTHGQRVQSASSNPAAAAADVQRGDGQATRGTVLSFAAGLEYGNIQELFDTIDELAKSLKPSDPGSGGTPPPGQNPDDKPPGGIDIGEIWDELDPDTKATVEAIGKEVATQAALLALIANEGHAKAFVSADAPFVLGREHFGGALTFGVNWSGAARAFGISEEIDFDTDAALKSIEDWLNTALPNRPVQFELDGGVEMYVDPATSAISIIADNDSSLVTKATQTTELNFGYSRQAWTNGHGTLYLGAEARLYLMRLSRLSVRFGDITNSEELFDAIRDQEFRNDTNIGVDFGALWTADNYQLGAQVTNINQPYFDFPDVNLSPYSSSNIISFLQNDQSYRMDRQLKLEASIFTDNRKWSAHAGIDANATVDPLGDDYQWATLSAGFTTDSWWLPGARFGFRQNLAGTKLRYLGVGVTAFKILNIDISSALDTVVIDDKTLPRGLMGSIGFQIVW